MRLVQREMRMLGQVGMMGEDEYGGRGEDGGRSGGGMGMLGWDGGAAVG